MRGLLAASLLLVCVEHARAQSDANRGDARALIATSAGALLAIGALGAGGIMLATHEDESGRKAGAFTLLGGVALAPIASHAIAGEWTRAAVFGAAPAVAAIGGMLMIEHAPVLSGHGELTERRVLALCYGVDVLAAAIGLFDTLNAGERARERARAIAIAPLLARDRVGIALGGLL
jgi:hypothetical protein